MAEETRQDYQGLADEVAERIAVGALRPGERLPTQRAYARRRGIAPSTATRVYRELVRRGLVAGEVGRGTFVRAAPAAGGPALAEPAAAPIDLELNYPVIPDQAALLARALGPLLRGDALEDALRPIGVVGTAAARERFAGLAAEDGWTPAPASVLFAGNGKQAAAAALSALVPPGGRLGVEALTYPVIKGLAQRLAITLVPLRMDERGVTPEALIATHRANPLRAVYLQPRSHNPLGHSMDDARRDEIANVLRHEGMYAIEDAVWSFLAPPGTASLASAAPERVVRVDSLSKRLAPGLSVGFLVAPASLHAELANAVRSSPALPGAFALEAAVRWLGDGTVERISAAKRADAAARARLARAILGGLGASTSEHSYSCWWELPEPWRAETFVAAAAGLGIAVTPGAAFAADPRSAPRAVRIGLASPTLDVLEDALRSLAELCRAGT
ncbi:PLP-dependent aminotransferase family protein [Actinospica robiniae]|uniref:aminotransferase-like domain-containing protein n=1 Tax=Actinospica robiniae TaxID=304901 RepID=UPI000554B19C|nr:PLP-dependent aminotransferase family protein [Actinospica robiniae]